MEHLVIAGAGAMGRELYWNAISSKGYNKTFDIKGYIDDMADEAQENLQKPLLGSIDEYKIQKEDVFICAIGNTKARENVVEKLKKKEYSKRLFSKMNYPILADNREDNRGKSNVIRYRKEPILYKRKNIYVTTQWFSGNRNDVIAWYHKHL